MYFDIIAHWWTGELIYTFPPSFLITQQWRGPPEELARNVRPFFRSLLPLAKSNGIVTAIVTFSGQISFIQHVLNSEFPEFGSEIPIRGEDRSWECSPSSVPSFLKPGTPGKHLGKQLHMASAAEELNSLRGFELSGPSTLLIDDDRNNIRIAKQHDVPAVHFNPDNIPQTIDDLIKFRSIHQSKSCPLVESIPSSMTSSASTGPKASSAKSGKGASGEDSSKCNLI